jgi:hypothetical protein
LRGRRVGHRFDRRLADLWIIEVQLAVLGDDVPAAVSVQEIVEHVVRVDPVGRHVQPEPVDVAYALRAQFLLHVFEKIVEGIPRLRHVLERKPGLFDQRPPDMVR